MRTAAVISALLVAAVRADEEAVRVATDANWNEVVENEPLILVEFYAPWCGHCKALTPKYEEAAKILAKEDPPIPLAKLDATEEKGQASKAGVQGYPTLKVFRNGVMSDYTGPRETDGIVEFMKSQVGPSSLEIDSTDALKAAISDKTLKEVAIVGFFSSKGVDYKIFMQMADHYRGKFALYHVTKQEVLEGAGFYGTNSAIIMYRPWAGRKKFKKVFRGSILKQSLLDFVQDNAFAPVTVADEDMMELVRARGKPLFRAFVAPGQETDKLVKELEPVEKEHGKKLSFVINDSGFDAYGVDEADLKKGAVFVIEDSRKRFMYTEQQGTVLEWVGKWVSKKAEAFVKSEKAAPKAEAGEVQVVVGKTFNEIVMDPTKNVLIEMYAPWCGHCKSLEPKYKELAMALKDEKDIIIAKMDATANDAPHKKYSASGFPTIFFAPADNKENPLSYDGAREVDDMASWVKEHSTKQ